MAKTKKPTGLTITRDGSKYIFKWKIGDKDYGAGQTLQYRTKGKNDWRKWNDISVGSSATSKTVTLSKSNYYPNDDKYLTKVEFRIKGKRRAYQEGTGNNQRTITPETSDWSNKTFDLDPPKAPTVTGSLGDQWNISKFVFSIASNDTDDNVYTSYEWQTIRVKDSNVTDGSKLTWSSSNAVWEKGTGTGTSLTKTFTEDTVSLNDGSRTRWFRVRAKGPAGASDWKYAKHVFAVPFKPTIKRIKVTEKSSNYLVDVRWEATSNSSHPIDEVAVEYAFGVPTADMEPPANPSWQEAVVSADTKASDEATFYTDGKLQDDECIFIRVTARRDTRENQSNVKIAEVGDLANPSDLSTTVSNKVATVTVTNNSSASIYTGSSSSVKKLFLQVIYKDRSKFKKGINIGVIPYGTQTADITLPSSATEGSYQIGVKAVVGTYSHTTKSDNSRRYKISSVMESPQTIWDRGTFPVAPTDLSYTYENGRLAVFWDWTWDDADACEISWSQNYYAWQSTDEPQTYAIDREVSKWYLSELELGQRYYVRIRLYDSENDIYSPYSARLKVNLTRPPLKPILNISDGVVSERGKFTCSWDYVSGDGTEQTTAQIRHNNTIIAKTGTSKAITLYAEDLGWTGGNEYALELRVKSASGSFSEWSDPVTVQVAEPLTATIVNTSLTDVTVEDDDNDTRTVLSLTEMPLEVEVTGAKQGVTVVSIERTEAYRMDRPDENVFDGYVGETVYLSSHYGEEPFTIEVTDLIGAVDDGAKYKIVATVLDGLGQTNSTELPFEVHWSHQAIVPEGRVTIDGTVAKIETVAPTGALTTDVCDIYRLSADMPELIYPNAVFGSTIVDPYPAINGGYRLVFKTANGDYITEDETPAWLDIESGFEYDKAIIEFGTDRVELYYNVDASHSWTKDFKETHYLGGAVQGDWNPSVSRTGSLSSVVLKPIEPDTITGLRRLAVYSGICNVRTLDGSSFHANVDVNEDNPHDRYGLISEFSLNFTRVDSQGYDGVTLEAWEE